MARTFSQPSRVYQPGSYGPFRIDSLTRNDANGLVATFTDEGWPEGVPLATVTLQWEVNGGTGQQPPPATYTLGKPRAPRTQVVMHMGIPQDEAGPIAITGGRISATVQTALRTTITLVPSFTEMARVAGGNPVA